MSDNELFDVNSNDDEHSEHHNPDNEPSKEGAPPSATDQNPDSDNIDRPIEENDIKSLRGNYIFTVGNVGVGKTALQTLLLFRLFNKDDVFFEYGNKFKDTNEHNATINSWMKQIRNGEFAPRTAMGKIEEFNFEVGQKGRKRLKLNFLEISGEDIKSIVPESGKGKAEVHRNLGLYLANKKLKKRFIFCSDAGEVPWGSSRRGHR